jgi:hypothetical protein
MRILAAFNKKVLTKEEVRDSLFGGSQFSIDITLDKKEWDKKKAQAEQEALGGYGSYGDFGGGAEAAPTDEAAVPEEEAVAAPEETTPAPEEAVVQTDSLSQGFADAKLHNQAIAEAKKKFKVYPSRWAEVWIAKRYKELLNVQRTNS